ncbi:MAG: PAS domain S-box protein, partial [Bacteroidales bacterium]|nr:PAS domain S-box protein [Bacteroidales bacterium]MBN2818976.1 PAS domain S-box protein [Bacteroidales bacterium]
MFKSLRYRLLTWFVLSTILISVLSVTMFQVHRSNKSEHKQAIENLEYLRYQFIKDQNEVNSFISTDINQEGFYQKGESKFLTTHYQLTNSIDSCFVNCYSGKLNTYPGIKESLHSIRDTYTDYCILLDSLVFKMYQRGFSNFGLEGELSSYYYSLENSCNLNKNKLLQLKLSETEYLYRYDTNSIGSLVVLCNNLITSVINSSKYTTSEKTQLVSWIKSYRNTFLEIVAADRKSGLAGNKGFKQDIDRLSSKLENSINHTISIAVQSYNVYNSRLNVIFGLTAFLLLALAFVFSVYTSRYFVYNLEQLTGYISELTRSNFNTSIQLNLRHSTQEVRKIYIEFRKMVAQLTMEKKQRDAALKIAEENQQRYRELANLLPQSIYETDRLGNLVYVNQTWYNTFGYSPEDIDKGLNLIELLNADPKRALFGYYKAENNEFQAKRKDGSKFPATVYSDVIRRGKKVVGRRGIIVDSTMRNKYVESLKR